MKEWRFIFVMNILWIMGLSSSYAQVRPSALPKKGTKLRTTEQKQPSVQEQLDALRQRVEALEAKAGIAPQGRLVECSKLKMGQMCKTTKGCFKMVNDDAFGIGIQEMGENCKQEGSVWARQLTATNVNYADAQKACPTGTRPPTENEFKALRELVSTEPNPDVDKYYATTELHRRDLNEHQLSDKGRSELYSLLPDMKNHRFWSSSPIDSIGALDFFGNRGDVDYVTRGNDGDAVRCVRWVNPFKAL